MTGMINHRVRTLHSSHCQQTVRCQQTVQCQQSGSTEDRPLWQKTTHPSTATFQVQVQCCFTSAESIRTIRDGEPRMPTLTFTQLQTSDGPLFVKPFLYLPVSMSHPSCETIFDFGTVFKETFNCVTKIRWKLWPTELGMKFKNE